MKLIVKTSSYNVWWGIYGLTDKFGWEDLSINNEDGKRIAKVCLNTKGYLRAGIVDIKEDPEETEFVQAVENYLKDNKIHYWYFYDDKGSEDFFEVAYSAPRNADGSKPSFLDIWHPDQSIGIDTILSAVKAFAKQFLAIDDCEVELKNITTYEDAVNSYKKELQIFEHQPLKIDFSPDLIIELSALWAMSESAVLAKLKKATE